MKHGFTTGYNVPRFYNIWSGMNQRCSNPKSISFKNYGYRGIKVEWKDFSSFKDDMYKKYINHVKRHGENNTTLERVDFNKNYSKSNCRWATYREQTRNKRGMVLQIWRRKKYFITELAQLWGIKAPALAYRIRSGWSLEKAFKEPIREKYRRKQ